MSTSYYFRRRPGAGPVAMALGLTASLSAMACGAGESGPGESRRALADGVAEPFADPPECGMVFDAGPELIGSTRAAAMRWSSATGCDIRVERGGIRIGLWSTVYGILQPNGGYKAAREGEEGAATMCGATWAGEMTAVAPCTLHTMLFTVEHEMGHHLRNAPGQGLHASHGLMAPDGDALLDVIDDATLAFVCEGFACSGFNPE